MIIIDSTQPTNTSRSRLFIPVVEVIPPETPEDGSLVYVRAANRIYFWRKNPNEWVSFGFGTPYTLVSTAALGESIVANGAGPVFTVKPLALSATIGNQLTITETSTDITVGSNGYFSITSPAQTPSSFSLIFGQNPAPGPTWALKTVSVLPPLSITDNGTTLDLKAAGIPTPGPGSNLILKTSGEIAAGMNSTTRIPFPTNVTLYSAPTVYKFDNQTYVTIFAGNPGIYFLSSSVRVEASNATSLNSVKISYTVSRQDMDDPAVFKIAILSGFQNASAGSDDNSPWFYDVETVLYVDGTKDVTLWANVDIGTVSTGSFGVLIKTGRFSITRLSETIPPGP